MNYSIEKITTLIGARRIGNAEAQIGWLLTDSRSLCFPEETLFFALKTQRNDGHRYIRDLYRRGVRNFVVESLPSFQGGGEQKASPLGGGWEGASWHNLDRRQDLPPHRVSRGMGVCTLPPASR